MLLYQLDARIWLGEESRRERRPVTLGSISASSLDRIADRGFRWLWLRGVWEVEPSAREHARRRAAWIEEIQQALPDVELRDIDGLRSPLEEHRVRQEMGGDDALESLRGDLARRDILLFLDFARDPRSAPGDETFRELSRVAMMADGLCVDGVAADAEFWRTAVPRVRASHSRLLFISDGGGALDACGLDHALDHELLARLVAVDAAAVRAHLERTVGAGDRLVRFLERDGGPRAPVAFQRPAYFAAAIVAYAAPGVKLVHDGQLEGRRAPHDVRIARRASELPDGEVEAFLDRLLEIVDWPRAEGDTAQLRPVREAWDGNATSQQLVALLVRGAAGEARLFAVNYGPLPAQGYVDLSALGPQGRAWVFQDLFSLAVYERDGDDLAARGLYLDLPPWDYHIFEAHPKN